MTQAKNELQREPSEELRNLQEELVACKLREAEANLSMKELRQKVTDVERHWEVYGALYLLLWYSHMYLRFGDIYGYIAMSTNDVPLDSSGFQMGFHHFKRYCYHT